MKRGRIAVVSMILLIATLLGACAGAPANSGVSAAKSEAAPATVPTAVQDVPPTAQPATIEDSSAPAGQETAAQGTGASLPAETRSSDGGGVTIEVRPADASGSGLVFDVSLNTHSVDLSYDYSALATLRDDRGNTYQATGWEGGSGGHHLQGQLVFGNGPRVLEPGVKWIELELKDIAGVPARTFRWDRE